VSGALEADLGHDERAAELLRQALAKTKARYGQSLLRAAFRLAVLEMKTGQNAEAKAQAESILRVNPNHRWAELLLKEVSASTAPVAAKTAPDAGTAADKPEKPEKPEKPRPAAGTAPPLAGGSYDALVRQGNKLSERGRTMQAIKAFEQALKLKASGPEALTGLGYCYLDQERFAGALSQFTRALRFSPTYGEALIGMAEAYKVQGNQRKALDYYRAYVTAHPSGSKSVMAQRNVNDLERKLGLNKPPAPSPTPPPGGAAPPPPPQPAPPAPSPSPSPSPSTGMPSGVPEKDVPAVPGAG
jgi:tetratricopeptide (TPR) repeat protein